MNYQKIAKQFTRGFAQGVKETPRKYFAPVTITFKAVLKILRRMGSYD